MLLYTVHGTQLDASQRDDMGPTSRRPVTHRGHHSGSQEWRPWRTNPLLLRLVIETWNATSLVGMDPELVHEVERYRVVVVRLTSLNVLEQASLRKA